MMRGMLAVLTVALASTPAVSASDVYEDTREVFLSDATSPDTMVLLVTGECDGMRLWARVETSSGDTVLTLSHVATRLFNDADTCLDPDRVIAEFVGPMAYATLPTEEDFTDPIRGYFPGDAETLAEARLSDLPVLCLKAGKSYADCYAADQKGAVVIYSTGS